MSAQVKCANAESDVALECNGMKPALVKEFPEYVAHRIAMFDRLLKTYKGIVAEKPREKITVTVNLKGGEKKEYEGLSWETLPIVVCKAVAPGIANETVIAKVDGNLWDLLRPLESSCTIEFLNFNDEEGRYVFWHSSAHVLGEASEHHYNCLICMGPPVDEGFYYELFMGDRQASTKDIPALEAQMKKITSERQPFERLEMRKEDLLEMFKYNEFKIRLIRDKIPDGTSTTVYRCGDLIDLCRGPHVPDTGRIKAFAVTKVCSSYWLGNAENEVLQRVYGVSFPDAKQMKEWKEFQEKAAKNDHRLIGKEQELFFFHELSPGSCFFLPHGARIYNTLIEFIREEYRKRGFEEVVTPNVYNVKLWETSGHWQNYQENMFSFEVEKEKFALKPMNCPGHCVMFNVRPRSYRELPLRLADFGVLHRNELSGTLTGLTRVRRFQQDDAHIFCAPEQIIDEMNGALDFLKHVYGVFGFTFTLALSTRPEKFLGDVGTWNQAEKQLEDALNRFGFPWKLNPGDGAFYGPKIDITIMDAMRRKFQCATIQLDFQLPIRFDLTFVTPDQKEVRPVIIHRAILGSVERMIAILTENFGGKFPFWISPRQIAVVPVSSESFEYADSVRQLCHDAGFYADADLSDKQLGKKIREAQMSRYNFILVVGKDEAAGQTVNVRMRDDDKQEVSSVSSFIERCTALKNERSLHSVNSDNTTQQSSA